MIVEQRLNAASEGAGQTSGRKLCWAEEWQMQRPWIGMTPQILNWSYPQVVK